MTTDDTPPTRHDDAWWALPRWKRALIRLGVITADPGPGPSR